MKINRRNRCSNDGIIFECAVRAILEKHRMIDVMKQIADDCDAGLVVDRDGIGSGITWLKEMHMHEDVPLKMGIAVVEIETFVGRPSEHIVVGCRIGPGRRAPENRMMSLYAGEGAKMLRRRTR